MRKPVSALAADGRWRTRCVTGSGSHHVHVQPQPTRPRRPAAGTTVHPWTRERAPEGREAGLRSSRTGESLGHTRADGIVAQPCTHSAAGERGREGARRSSANHAFQNRASERASARGSFRPGGRSRARHVARDRHRSRRDVCGRHASGLGRERQRRGGRRQRSRFRDDRWAGGDGCRWVSSHPGRREPSHASPRRCHWPWDADWLRGRRDCRRR